MGTVSNVHVVDNGYPDEAVQMYARVVEELILLRGRENYQQAAAYLSQMRKLYQKMGREKTWETYLAGLRSNYKSLRALKEELEKKGF